MVTLSINGITMDGMWVILVFGGLLHLGNEKLKTLSNAMISPGAVLKSPRGYSWADTLTVCSEEHIGPGIMAISQLGAEI